MNILKLYKNRGETPLECLERFKKDNPEHKDQKMTYAGRLDPLAEGLLLVLVGEECKNKEKYLGLDKEYDVDVLFGFATDTYDILGRVVCHSCAGEEANTWSFRKTLNVLCSKCERCTASVRREIPVLIQDTLDFRLRENDIQAVLQSFVGKFSQKYPPFSSKTIKGKTLFSLIKSGELNDDEIPSKDVEIKSFELLGERTIPKEDLEKYIIESIDLVKGDFRQKEILETWNSVLGSVIPAQAGIQVEFPIISIRVNCTSGTYMRSLANSIGEKVGIPALALNIKRIKLGNYNI